VNTQVIFCTALAQLYPVKAYNTTVESVVAHRGIETRLLHNLIEVRGGSHPGALEHVSGGNTGLPLGLLAPGAQGTPA
jgi:sulfide:quinone oxidoreductase